MMLQKEPFSILMMLELPLVADKQHAPPAILPAHNGQRWNWEVVILPTFRLFPSLPIFSICFDWLPAFPVFSAPTAFSQQQAGQAVQAAAGAAVDLSPHHPHLMEFKDLIQLGVRYRHETLTTTFLTAVNAVCPILVQSLHGCNFLLKITLTLRFASKEHKDLLSNKNRLC